MKKSEGLSFFITILIAVVIALFIRNFIFNIAVVNGQSMEPTLHEKDKLLCLSYRRFTDVKPGEVVVISPPNDNRKFIKRVIATGGDTIEFKEGRVFVNGKELDETYTSSDITYSDAEKFVLKENEYFVMGDNRLPGKSEDSRFFGPIDKKRINSVATFRILPFSNRGKI